MTPRLAYVLIIIVLVAPQLPTVLTWLAVAFAFTGWLLTWDENGGEYAEMRQLKRAQDLTASNVTTLRSER